MTTGEAVLWVAVIVVLFGGGTIALFFEGIRNVVKAWSGGNAVLRGRVKKLEADVDVLLQMRQRDVEAMQRWVREANAALTQVNGPVLPAPDFDLVNWQALSEIKTKERRQVARAKEKRQ